MSYRPSPGYNKSPSNRSRSPERGLANTYSRKRSPYQPSHGRRIVQTYQQSSDQLFPDLSTTNTELLNIRLEAADMSDNELIGLSSQLQDTLDVVNLELRKRRIL